MTSEHIEAKVRILEAAKNEFAEKGLAGSRIGEIAERAGVAAGLVHYYFGSKEKLYKAVFDSLFEVCNEDLLNGIYVKGFELNIVQKVYLVIYSFSRFFALHKDLDMFRIFFREMAEQNGYIFELVKSHAAPTDIVLANMVRKGIDEGYFSCSNPTLTSMMIVNMFGSYCVHRHIFRESRYYTDFFGEEESGESFLLSFATEYFFKLLAKDGEKMAVPEIPSELLDAVDGFIRIFVKRRTGVSPEMLMRYVLKIMGDDYENYTQYGNK